MSALKDASKPASEVISETMKAEGGPAKGSTAAQMQSEVANSQQSNTSSNPKSSEGQTISEVAKAEGGTTKGSKSAQLQSELTKQRNAEQGVYDNNTNNTNGTTSSNTTQSPEAQSISEVAQAEGGTTKGSKSAQMQSELTKKRNAEQGVYDDNTTNTATTGKSPAGQAISEVAKAEGGTTKGSTSAKMQSELSKAQNAGQTPNLSTDPITQSHNTKEANFEDAKARIVPKMENDPEHVTKEDASLLRSRETRAHGVTEKGGVAATAQHLAAENEKKGTV